MADYLQSGDHGPPLATDRERVQSIANALWSLGLGIVRIRDLETAAIDNALAACNGNRTHAAQRLGISVRTLQRKLKLRPDATPADLTG
jgi:DNA-binding NtrC family response regulator